jgi:chromosome segregation ATPase
MCKCCSNLQFKERAPLIARDSEALNSTMMENERLLSDYDKMAQELHSEQAECQQAKKAIGLLKRDNERMQTHLDDLSRQVCYKSYQTIFFTSF